MTPEQRIQHDALVDNLQRAENAYNMYSMCNTFGRPEDELREIGRKHHAAYTEVLEAMAMLRKFRAELVSA